MPRKPFVSDPDFTLYHGEALEVLRELPSESIDCLITSPPYFGLRDYLTGIWINGDDNCEHSVSGQIEDSKAPGAISTGQRPGADSSICRKCGASRIDKQIGIESTIGEYVARMVEIFREARRVLTTNATAWINLGDSYAGSGKGGSVSEESLAKLREKDTTVSIAKGGGQPYVPQLAPNALKVPAGLKPKDLCGIPWRIALALQDNGWYLRCDIIFHKTNAMPESVRDRPSKAHEYIFLMTKNPNYYYDQESIREPAKWERWGDFTNNKHEGSESTVSWMGSSSKEDLLERVRDSKNIRSVWSIPTQSYPDAHFATYPEELVRRCLLAGCPERVCMTCGEPSKRMTEIEYEEAGLNNASLKTKGGGDAKSILSNRPYETRMLRHVSTTGFSDCGHNNWRSGVVLDPFFGSGTTGLVARKHGRHTLGIELNESYCQMAARRLQQLSLFTEID